MRDDLTDKINSKEVSKETIDSRTKNNLDSEYNKNYVHDFRKDIPPFETRHSEAPTRTHIPLSTTQLESNNCLHSQKCTYSKCIPSRIDLKVASF